MCVLLEKEQYTHAGREPLQTACDYVPTCPQYCGTCRTGLLQCQYHQLSSEQINPFQYHSGSYLREETNGLKLKATGKYSNLQK